jgi:hypothetical protein
LWSTASRAFLSAGELRATANPRRSRVRCDYAEWDRYESGAPGYFIAFRRIIFSILSTLEEPNSNSVRR